MKVSFIWAQPCEAQVGSKCGGNLILDMFRIFCCSSFFSAVCSFEAPLAGMLTERRRTVRKQYEALQQRRALQDTTNHHHDNINLKDTPSPHPNNITSVLVLPSRVCPTLHLDYTQKLQLQQQIQQVRKTAVSGMFDVQVVVLTEEERTVPGTWTPNTKGQWLFLSVSQHVQLLTQVHLLSRRVDALNHEAGITKQYLVSQEQPSLSLCLFVFHY